MVKLGGPAYRIGVGGGAASSMVQGANVEELDFQVNTSFSFNNLICTLEST